MRIAGLLRGMALNESGLHGCFAVAPGVNHTLSINLALATIAIILCSRLGILNLWVW